MNHELETIYSKILLNSKNHADKLALICGDVKFTYHELSVRINRLAGYLTHHGVQKGDRICIGLHSKAECLIAVIAGMAVGGISVPLPYNSYLEQQWMISDCEPTAIVSDSFNNNRIQQYINSERTFLVDAKIAEDEEMPFLSAPDLSSEDVAMMFYTSGTTSGVKTGILISYNNLVQTVTYMNNFMQLQPDIVEYVVAPVNHAFGFGRCRAVFQIGGTLVLNDGIFNPARVLIALEKYRCNAISSVSTGFALLLENYERYLRPIGENIEWVEIGSLPLHVSHKKKLLDVLPKARIFMNYGLTEAMRTTLIELRSEIDKIETVGRPSPGLEVKIINDKGEVLPQGKLGEISVKGANVAKGFWKQAELWQNRYHKEWLRTGDVGHLDEDGYIILSGRKDDIINVGGEKFFPLEVEACLKDLFEEVSYCICGIIDPDGLMGELPVLCVEGKNNVDITKVQRCLKGIVDDYKIPKDIYHFNSLPRTHNGKVKRYKIKEQLFKDKS